MNDSWQMKKFYASFVKAKDMIDVQGWLIIYSTIDPRNSKGVLIIMPQGLRHVPCPFSTESSFKLVI